LPAQYVRAYVQRNKTDEADATALIEAARCTQIRPVPVKCELFTPPDVELLVGNRQLKAILGQIHTHSRSTHGRLLLSESLTYYQLGT
jgi:transposase